MSRMVPAPGGDPAPRSGPRASRMEGRVLRAAAETGVDAAGLDRLALALRVAMRPRESGPAALPSDRDPDALHPGRTVLILLADLGECDPEVLSVAALAESRRPELRATAEAARTVLGAKGAALWAALPSLAWSGEDGVAGGEGEGSGSPPPEDSFLLESLVIAEPELRRIVLAEALDQLRHAHLWPEGPGRERAVALATGVFAPLATRTHPALERRFNWWVRRVAPALGRVAG